jgi:hypothetical protein
MSTTDHRRRFHPGVRELGIVGLALLVVVVLLSPDGSDGTLRSVLGGLTVLMIPGWLVGRLADEDSDAVARLVGGMVATLAICAVCAYVGSEHGIRVATAVFAVPLLAIVAVATLLGLKGSKVPRAPLTPLLAALVFGAVALLGALGAHLVLPAVPIEAAFSIESAHAVVSTEDVVVRVTVTRVHTEEPTQLQMFVGFPHESTYLEHTYLIPSDEPKAFLSLRLPRGSTTCPDFVRLEAPNHAFLTPPVTCKPQ